MGHSTHRTSLIHHKSDRSCNAIVCCSGFVNTCVKLIRAVAYGLFEYAYGKRNKTHKMGKFNQRVLFISSNHDAMGYPDLSLGEIICWGSTA